jgi:hypothetical protein
MDLYCHDHETLAALRRAIYARLKARARGKFSVFFSVLRIFEILIPTDPDSDPVPRIRTSD